MPYIQGARAFVVGVSLAGIIAIGGCSGQEQAPPVATQSDSPAAEGNAIPAAGSPPSALVRVGESAEDLFDAAQMSKWDAAAAAAQALKESAAALNFAELKPDDLVAQLRTRLAEVEEAAKASQRVQSMDSANSITRLVADLSAPYQTEIPYEIVLLDYYGRQLELGLAASRPATLERATADLRQTWNAIEPTIVRRGHGDDARQFTDIVVQLEGAQRPDDFVAPVQAELAAVDRLEKIFRP